ncbi:hypothetical protein [Microcystis aeruginosa]|nr:hypothetical protein [Microcystis aeruginosa]
MYYQPSPKNENLVPHLKKSWELVGRHFPFFNLNLAEITLS